VVGRADFAGTKRFRVVRQLGAGGAGVVYEVEDRERHERVALKRLRHTDPLALQRFKREFRAVQDLQHPNLVHLGELFEDNGVWFFTMELVEGTDLLTYVHRHVAAATSDFQTTIAPPYDEARLRACFQQLAVALHTLHGTHKVHRDVKPSNVRVTTVGRVVLLDFGLVTELALDRVTTEGDIVGTVVYMPPEQAAGDAVGPAADWYSFGVVLYEGLTGAVPFAGAPMQILLDKHQVPPTPPRARVPDVSPDLDDLCVRLLARDPTQRPLGDEVLRRLGAPLTTHRPRAVTGGSHLTANVPFVGRDRQLAVLDAAYREVRGGKTVTIHLHGQSGMGKSALLGHFLATMEAGVDRAMILRGRCYEREAARFKALDGVIDHLARTLQRMPAAERQQFVPSNAALLLKLFPALGRVDALARAPWSRRQARDPLEERRWMFASLRELLSLVAERFPLVIAIEDMQWADGDSRELLGQLLAASISPPPPMLLLVTSRASRLSLARDDGDGAWPGDLRAVEIGPLPTDDATALATGLLASAPDVDPEALAAEAGGHPMFIAELARHVTLRGANRSAVVSLDEAIIARARELPSEAQRVLEILVVASAPLAPPLLEQAASLEPGELSRQAAVLRTAAFIRSAGDREARRFEPFHDRVREAMLAALSAADRAHYHATLAPLLEHETGSDPERVAEHYLAAGNTTRAAELFSLAADRAEVGYAFERAAALHLRQFELCTLSRAEESRLHRRIASVLAAAGQSRAAADEYLQAVEGAMGADVLELRRLAATHLLRSGHLREGLSILGDSLEAVGLRLPKSRAGAIASYIWQRAGLRLSRRQLQFRERDDIPPGELVRLDALYAAVVGMGWVDGIRAAPLVTRMLRLALAVGERERLAKALAGEAVFVSLPGVRALRTTMRTRAILEQAVETLDSPFWRGLVTGADAIIAQNESRFTDAVSLTGDALAHFDAARGLDTSVERGTSIMFRMIASVFVGRYRALIREMQEALADADARGDRWQASLLRLHNAYISLGRDDDPDAALALLEAGIAPWRDWPFGFLHFTWLANTVAAHAYANRWDEARAIARAHGAPLRRSGQLRVQAIRQFWTARLAAFALREHGDSGSARALSRAGSLGRRLEHEGTIAAAASAALVRAQILAARARDDLAIAQLHIAAELGERGGTPPVIWVASWYEGILRGGGEGDALVAGARAACAKEGVANPLRWLSCFYNVPYLIEPPSGRHR
jgi:eukaryotic-like serine/threonine-protein kinase